MVMHATYTAQPPPGDSIWTLQHNQGSFRFSDVSESIRLKFLLNVSNGTHFSDLSTTACDTFWGRSANGTHTTPASTHHQIDCRIIMATDEVNTLNLLDLPVDILSLILKPLVTSSMPIQLCPCTPSPIDPLPILLSHPALHNIAAPLLYAGNEFLLDATGPHAQHIRRELQTVPSGADERLPGRASLLTTPGALRRIARLELRIDRLRGWLGSDVVPLLTELAVQGRMDYLTIWVRTPAEPRTPMCFQPVKHEKDMQMFARPPLEGLLRVLADPYLISAQLWVDAQHPKTWCRFHSGGCGAEGGYPGPEGERSRRVEIEWREIIRLVDPERKEITVIGTEKKW